MYNLIINEIQLTIKAYMQFFFKLKPKGGGKNYGKPYQAQF